MRLSRLAWCALAVGTGQAVLDYVTPYVKEREAFGEPIAHRQSVAFMVADMAIELQSMRLLTYKAAARAAAGKDFAREVALARKLCAEKGMQIGLDGVQLLGGHGFVKEHPVERWYRDLRAIGVMEGCGAGLMINLDDPKKFRPLVGQAHQVAMNMLRPISRKYDKAEHEYPKELDMLAAMIDGALGVRREPGRGRRRREARRSDRRATTARVKNGTNLASVMSIAEMCWGDVGLLLSMPRQGLGNSAIASVADDEQQQRFEGVWAGDGDHRARHRLRLGRTSRTTAVRDGDEYVLNGEKIFVTSGDRADAIVVWATLDKSLGRAAIKSFVVPKGTPGMNVERLEHKLGIQASDTATIRFENCRVPADNLLGSPEIDTKQGFAGAMATFDNTRPLVAAMAVGCARAALDLTRDLLAQAGVEVDYDRPAITQSAAAAKFLQMEADWEAAHLLTLQAAWLADNRKPNSLEASMAKAKAGRVGSDITLVVRRAVRVRSATARPSCSRSGRATRKILDIFEGTQQIQQLIVARRVLGLSQRRAQVEEPALVGPAPGFRAGALVRGQSVAVLGRCRLLRREPSWAAASALGRGRLRGRSLLRGGLLGRRLLRDDAGHVDRRDLGRTSRQLLDSGSAAGLSVTSSHSGTGVADFRPDTLATLSAALLVTCPATTLPTANAPLACPAALPAAPAGSFTTPLTVPTTVSWIFWRGLFLATGDPFVRERAVLLWIQARGHRDSRASASRPTATSHQVSGGAGLGEQMLGRAEAGTRRRPGRSRVRRRRAGPRGTRAIAEPPKPPPVIRAPTAPASTAVVTATSSSGQEISKSSRIETCESRNSVPTAAQSDAASAATAAAPARSR